MVKSLVFKPPFEYQTNHLNTGPSSDQTTLDHLNTRLVCYSVPTVCIFFFFRNCLCLYKDPKNVDRFSLSIQFVIYLCVSHLKTIQTTLKDPENDDPNLWSQEETERMLQFVAKVISLF